LEKNGLFNHALKWGLIIGITNIILTALVYMIEETLMIKWWFGLLILAVNVILIIHAVNQYRKTFGGFMNFKRSFTVTFLTLIVASIIGTLFTLILYQVIDPDLPARLTKAAIEQTKQMMSNFGAPHAQLDEQLSKIEEKTASQFTAMGTLKGFGIRLIFYFIISLIVGAIIKKKEKVN
jgi:hypothetical protein